MLKYLKQNENVMKYKLVYTGLIFLVYIFGKNIPLCGVDMSAYTVEAAGAEEILMQMISGDTYRCSIFALGIFPFMISNILVPLAFAIRNLFSKARVSPKAMGYATAFVTLTIAILQAGVQLPKLKFAVPAEMLAMTKVVAGVEMVTGVMIMDGWKEWTIWNWRKNGLCIGQYFGTVDGYFLGISHTGSFASFSGRGCYDGRYDRYGKCRNANPCAESFHT